jgi:asparagine synthase (glutamine-hydrolysing)
MCGIAGGFWGTPDSKIESRMISALGVMRERGPDNQTHHLHTLGRGLAVLGHTRLSVIDISDRASQPMRSSDGRYSLIFNGEIYNYLELRTELSRSGYSFTTQSDTEVLLAAWKAWGRDALRRLKGMFAFAVFDFQQQSCTLVRDAFGIKPLFYTNADGAFYFASDLRAMRALSLNKPSLNWQRAYDFLVHGEYDFGAETFFEEFRTLQPGHLMVVDLHSTKCAVPQRWWTPSILLTSKLSFVSASEQLREMLLENVRLHLRSDVPLGVTLSGGIDSSAIACMVRHLKPDVPIHTFSFIIKHGPESEESWVDKINGHIKSVAHKVSVTSDELKVDLENLIDTQGEPFGSTSIYAQYRVFKLAKESGVTVTLDGQGADEMLGGYMGFPGQRVKSLLEQRRYLDSVRFLNSWAKWPNRSLSAGLKRVVGAYSSGKVHQFLHGLNGSTVAPSWINEGPLLENGVKMRFPKIFREGSQGRNMMDDLAMALTERGLPGLLRHGDRNSMRFSIESRVPFLTTDLADFALSQPEEYLVSLRGESKYLLRTAMRGIVPDEVLDRRDKIGFATPEKEWLLGMASTIRPWLSEDLGLPFLDQIKMCQHFDQIVSGKRPFTWQVWRWINFCRWYRCLA